MGAEHRDRSDVESGEADWEGYPPYRWFMDQVGGPNKLIPRQDGLPWMLRIHHKEITEAAGVGNRMNRGVRSMVKSVDEFYGFRPSNARNYGTGEQPTEDANPARVFFEGTAIGPEESEGLREIIDTSTREYLERVRTIREFPASVENIGAGIFKRVLVGRITKQAAAIEIKKKFL
jgi:hypothetical protein